MTGRRSHGRLSALNGVVHQGIAARVPTDRGLMAGRCSIAPHIFADGGERGAMPSQ